MRKLGRKFLFAVALCVILICYAMTANGMEMQLRALLLALAAVVGCVWMVCESRIDRAAAPLNLPPRPVHCDGKPPDRGEQ